jgi:hypothetical protein
VAEGWDLTDFGAPWPKGRMPADMDPAELIVGFFDAERAVGVRWTAAEFNEKCASYFSQHGLLGGCQLTEPQLERIRVFLGELSARWRAVPPGETLELPFDRATSKARTEEAP